MVLINQKNCDKTRKNLGLPDCVIQEGRLTGFIITPKGWSLDLSTGTFDKAYVNEQIQQGNFVPILGAVQAENKTPEATIEEFQGGIKSVVRNGLPEYVFKFVKGGWKFANALYSYNSNQAFDVLFVFNSGAIAGATNGTELTGYDLGMLNNGTYMFTDGAVTSYVMTTIQLVNEMQFNTSVALLDYSVLDFNPNTDINPISDIMLTGRAVVSLSKVYFKAKFAMNQSSNLLGLALANLKYTIDGASATPTASSLVYDPTLEEWSFGTPTITTASRLVISLYDTTNVVAAAKVGNKYYKGATGQITPTA